ncbi:VOC family protein [Sinomonas terrae]|uniref:VOC family protein n=1 Tax=Sinomonas terrae TaxID=2908838 RepID=A0ABS9U214_9MICC|nr:VOC family protein [Sinomonas terrae]MCH6470728.1 VOC family protein [Sinomonas terrae]
MASRIDAALPHLLGPRMQVGMVVDDIQKAAAFWAEEMHVGPWILIEDGIGDRRFMYRGETSEVRFSVAFSYTGETQLELIAQTNSAPSPFRDFLASGKEGIHHLGFWPEDFEASCSSLETAGFVELCSIHLPEGTRNGIYYTAPPMVGGIVELAPLTPFRRTYMTAIERLSTAWDGTRPVRRFGTRNDFIASADFQVDSLD